MCRARLLIAPKSTKRSLGSSAMRQLRVKQMGVRADPTGSILTYQFTVDVPDTHLNHDPFFIIWSVGALAVVRGVVIRIIPAESIQDKYF